MFFRIHPGACIGWKNIPKLSDKSKFDDIPWLRQNHPVCNCFHNIDISRKRAGFVFLFPRSILGTLHSYHIVSVKLPMDGNFSRKANGFAFKARQLKITYYMNVRVALYTDNGIKIQSLLFFCFNTYIIKTSTELNIYLSVILMKWKEKIIIKLLKKY